MAQARHIVDVLIAERAPRLVASPLWPLARVVLDGLLNRRTAVRMADSIAQRGGAEALELVSRLLDLRVEVEGLEHLPGSGACVIVANHPTGIADGIAVWDALKPVRPDLMFYANADAHRVCPGFVDTLIPVEWVEAKRTREKTRRTLQLTSEALARGVPLMIFPAGKLARMVEGRLVDPPWMASAISIARRSGLPVVPVHVRGPHATLFHLFDRISPELRDITLFHELLNKRGRTYHLRLGVPIEPAQLAGDAEAVTRAVKDHVEQALAASPDARFSDAGFRAPHPVA
jgi:putative hemolysin